MSNAKFLNIRRLISTYNLKIDCEVLPENLKCVKCKLVVKDACQLPCCCRICRACLDYLMANGNEFCPGISEDCKESRLSDFATDYSINKNISKLIVKCPHNRCEHQCQLVELENHMIFCSRKNLECLKDMLPVEELSGFFQQENRSQCEILIEMIVDMRRDIDSYKIEIEMLKRNDESHKEEIEMLKHNLELKDDHIRTILDQMGHLENEVKLIKEEKTNLTDRIRNLSEKIDGEIDERRESDERDLVNVIEHIDKEITTIAAVIGSNKDQLDTAIISVKDNIKSMNEDNTKLIKSDIDYIKSQVQSIQGLMGQIDVKCEWMIDVDVGKTNWIGEEGRTSQYFTGAVYPYKYQLSSHNYIYDDELRIRLRICTGTRDAQLPWPFSGTVAITVTDRSKREVCQSIIRKCKISRPAENNHSNSTPFKFSHSTLRRAGLDLTNGLRVVCMIVPFHSGR